jgi:nucleotide-binding universal stress UspA family protein
VKLVEARPVAATAVRNILLATDFSEASEAALPYVAALSLGCGAEIHVVHVLPEITFLRPGAPDSSIIGSIYEDAHGNAQAKMRVLAGRLRNLPHRLHVRHGSIAETIADLVEEFAIDLVVAGTHGRTGLGRLVLGSVAGEILLRASCPMLTVGPSLVAAAHKHSRPQRDVPPPQIQIRNILYATDYQQPCDDRSLALAVCLARKFDARLGLLQVIEPYGDGRQERPECVDSVLRRLEELVPEEAGLRRPPEALAAVGPAVESILRTAAERDTDLIVLGARAANGHLGAATQFSAASAHRVIVSASCPVLTVQCGN